MKRLFFLLFMAFSFTIFAQQKINYKAVFQYKKIVDEKEKARRDSLTKANPEMADVMKMIRKKFDNREFEMYFDKDESIYKQIHKLDAPTKTEGFSFKLPDHTLYKNIKENKYVARSPLFQETYIVVDTLPDYHWKVTGESKKIGNYTVIKAEGVEKKKNWRTGKEQEVKITAWFTPEIPIGNGPKKYHGLPGFIMELDRKGEVLLCKQIIVNPKDKKEIKQPDDGKKVSEAEYEKIRKKMMEKMKKMYENRRSDNRGGTRRIIIR